MHRIITTLFVLSASLNAFANKYAYKDFSPRVQKGIVELARRLNVSKLPVDYEKGANLTSKLKILNVNRHGLTLEELGSDTNHVIIDDGANLFVRGPGDWSLLENDQHTIRAPLIEPFEDGYLVRVDNLTQQLVDKQDIQKIRIESNGAIVPFGKAFLRASYNWGERVYEKKNPSVFSPELTQIQVTDIDKANYFLAWGEGRDQQKGALYIDKGNLAAPEALEHLLGHRVMFMYPLGRDHYHFHLDTDRHQIATDQDLNDRTGSFAAKKVENFGDFFRITRVDHLQQLMTKDPLGELLGDVHFNIERDTHTGHFTFHELDGTSNKW